MSKAKSRLKHKPITDSKYFSLSSKPEATSKIPSPKTDIHGRTARSKYYPTLVLGIFFGLALGYLILNIPPEQVKNTLLPGTYLPLLLIFFMMMGFISSFIFLNSRRGFVFSGFLTTLLALKVQEVNIDPTVLGITTAIFVVILIAWEVHLTLTNRK